MKTILQGTLTVATITAQVAIWSVRIAADEVTDTAREWFAEHVRERMFPTVPMDER